MTTSTDRSGDVMPTGINVDRMAWVHRLQLLLGANPTSLPGTLDDALFKFVDQAMTAARMQALLDVTVYDDADPATHPRDGRVVAVLRRYCSDGAWACLDDEAPNYEHVAPGDRWLWVPPEATDG